jgi:hypothetical protein
MADGFGAIAGLGLEKAEAAARDKSVAQNGREEASVSGTLNFAGRTLDMNGGVIANPQLEFTTEADGKDSLAIDALVSDEQRTKEVADTYLIFVAAVLKKRAKLTSEPRRRSKGCVTRQIFQH